MIFLEKNHYTAFELKTGNASKIDLPNSLTQTFEVYRNA